MEAANGRNRQPAELKNPWNERGHCGVRINAARNGDCERRGRGGRQHAGQQERRQQVGFDRGHG